jgi:hypothetical protein
MFGLRRCRLRGDQSEPAKKKEEDAHRLSRGRAPP